MGTNPIKLLPFQDHCMKCGDPNRANVRFVDAHEKYKRGEILLQVECLRWFCQSCDYVWYTIPYDIHLAQTGNQPPL